MTTASISRTITQLARTAEREPDQRPLDFRLIGRLMQFTVPYARQRNWLLVCVLLRSVQLPALVWGLALIIDQLTAQGNPTALFWGVAGYALLAVTTQTVLHFRSRLAFELGEGVVFELRNRLFEHLQRMPMAFYHRTKVGRIISRMLSDIEEVRGGVQEVLFVSLVQLGHMVVAAIFMVWYDWTLFLVVLGMAPFLWGVNHHFHRRLSKGLRRLRESFSRVTATLAESVLGIRVTQGFVRQDENARLFQDLLVEHAENNFRVARTSGTFVPILDLGGQFFVALLLLVGGSRVLMPHSSLEIGDLVGFLFMAQMFFDPIIHLGNQYHQALTAMAGAERVFGLLDTAPDWSDPPGAVPIESVRGQVEFERVSFGYDAGRTVLHEVSFVAQPHQLIALVGPTGSGKTTIASLIAKFYLPAEGRLLVDGEDLARVRSDAWHRQVAIVPQQGFLFSGSVAANIRVGRPQASDEQVARAVRQLGCLDLFEQLPNGLETLVGERGGSVSMGQRQLVCFARALLADPRILILDEATSSIDAATEARMRDALRLLLAGRTSFVVAHRLSTIQHADLILVLDHGRIVERGTHEELVRAGGPYSRQHQRFLQR